MASLVNLSTMPATMRSLPVDERGYPVPWFVAWLPNGKPEFRAMDAEKFVAAIRKHLCWVCGAKLGVNVAFVVGPMCGINRVSSEPPSHLDCARWSAENCPFLANPRMVRREDDVTRELQQNVAGYGIKRNPGVAMVWICRGYEVIPDGKGKQLILMGVPDWIEWYSEGRKAKRDEILESIETGFPILAAAAQVEPGGLEHILESRARFERKYLPAV